MRIAARARLSAGLGRTASEIFETTYRMKLTAEDYADVEAHCWRNWRVRLTPKSSRELIRLALEMKAVRPDWIADDLESRLAVKVRRQHPRNWALVLILLKWVLPIIIELVIEWWERRQAATEADKKGWSV